MEMLFGVIYIALQIYSFILLARVLTTWFPNLDRSNPIVRFLFEATEPVLRPIREMLPPTSGMDFSPIVAFLGIYVLMMLVTNLA